MSYFLTFATMQIKLQKNLKEISVFVWIVLLVVIVAFLVRNKWDLTSIVDSTSKEAWIKTVYKQTQDKWQLILISDFSSDDLWLWIAWKYWSKTAIEARINWEYAVSFITNEDWTFRFKSSINWALELIDKDTWKTVFKKDWKTYNK